MASFLFLFLWVAALITIYVVLKVTIGYTRREPMFAIKAFSSAFASAGFGYLFKGHVEVKLVLWGVGGALLYVLYRLAKTDA
jgi:hypothetical protein